MLNNNLISKWDEILHYKNIGNSNYTGTIAWHFKQNKEKSHKIYRKLSEINKSNEHNTTSAEYKLLEQEFIKQLPHTEAYYLKLSIFNLDNDLQHPNDRNTKEYSSKMRNLTIRLFKAEQQILNQSMNLQPITNSELLGI